MRCFYPLMVQITLKCLCYQTEDNTAGYQVNILSKFTIEGISGTFQEEQGIISLICLIFCGAHIVPSSLLFHSQCYVL